MSYYINSKYVQELTPKDFDPLMSWKCTKYKNSIILFYAPWCKFCKLIKKQYEQLASEGHIQFCAFDCEKYKPQFDCIRYDLPDLIRFYPTIIYYKNYVPSQVIDRVQLESVYRRIIRK